MTADQHWDDFMDLADAVGVTRTYVHPSMQDRINEIAARDVALIWSQAAAGVDILDVPIPFTLVLDHAVCDHGDCDQVICACVTGLCKDTVELLCTHHEVLCDEHRLECSDCRRDFADDGGA